MPKTDRERLEDNNDSLLRIKEKANNLPDAKINVTNGTVDGHTLILSNTPPAPVLPYVELEYIQSTGTQYIDTKFIPDATSKIEATAELLSLLGGTDYEASVEGMKIFGIASIGGENSRIVLGTSVSPFRFYAGLGAYNLNETISSENVLYGKMRFFVDLYNNTYGYGSNTFTNSNSNNFRNINNFSVYLFARRGADSNLQPRPEGNGKMLLYECKCYSNNTLQKHFIPCKLIDTGEVGLWELNEDKFYGNSGIGSFIAGPEKLNKPYVELEYIQGTGTQYLDTNYVPTFGCEIIFEHITIPVQTQGTIFWCTGQSGEYKMGLRVYEGNNEDAYYNYFRTDTTQFKHGFITNGILRLTSNSELYYNDTLKVTSNYGNTGTIINTLCLFATYNLGNTIGQGKMGRITITNNGVLQRQFIPVRRISDNEICMYEVQTKTFITNIGTGSFIAGPEVN